jgi:hypothetical protein
MYAAFHVKNVGGVDISMLEVRLPVGAFAVTGLRDPCTMEGNTIVWRGPLQIDRTAVCDFTLTPVNRSKTTLQPTLNFTDGRVRQFIRGTTVTIDARTNLVSLRLANTSAPLGSTISGMIDINNTYSDQDLLVSGTLSAPGAEVSGSVAYDEIVREGSSIGLPFQIRLLRIGNVSVFASSKIKVGMDNANLTDSKVIRSYPLLALKVFGQLALPKAGPATVDIEAQNLGNIGFTNVSLHIWPPAPLVMPAQGLPVNLPAGRNEQLYMATFNVPFNDSSVLIPYNVTFTTEFGEAVVANGNVTVRVGKAATKYLPPTPPAVKPKANITTTTKTSTPAKAAAQTPAQAAAASAQSIDTLLVIVAIAMAAGAAFWFFSMAGAGRGPKPPEY